MRYYPVLLDIAGKNCLVVGGGNVGTRKVQTLLECGATVTVVSPEFTDSLRNLAGNESVTLIQRHWQPSDLDGMFLAIGAANDETVNRQIHAEAERRNLLCNIADRPEICNFILPSVVNRGDLIIAVSTSGKSPAFAKRLRKELEMQFGDEYAIFLDWMGAIRKKLLSQSHAPEAHKPLFEQLIDRGLLNLIKNRDNEAIRRLLEEVLGENWEKEAYTNG